MARPHLLSKLLATRSEGVNGWDYLSVATYGVGQIDRRHLPRARGRFARTKYLCNQNTVRILQADRRFV